MKYYTGVGSRETPQEILDMMFKLGRKLADAGWILRSGAAKGADQAFECGWVQHVAQHTDYTMTEAEIYLPWSGYENHEKDGMFGCNILMPEGSDAVKTASRIAEMIHPNWTACKRGARAMHTRNVFQVLGQDLATPSKMLICWMNTKDPEGSRGGTATAWNLAKRNKIPCFNLNVDVHYARIQKFLEE